MRVVLIGAVGLALVAVPGTAQEAGPRAASTGPRPILEAPGHHDDHLLVRIAAHPRPAARSENLGRSVLGRQIQAVAVGDPKSGRKVLVVGCIHGDECAGIAVARLLAAGPRPHGVELWIVPTLNPDGRVAGTRQNAHGVDLNRNFAWGWQPIGRPGHAHYSGPRPLSEPETRIARRLIERLRPDLTIWFHQPQALVRTGGGRSAAARRYGRLVGLPFRELPVPPGAATKWQSQRFPGTASFVVELPPGALSGRDAERHAAAVRKLAY